MTVLSMPVSAAAPKANTTRNTTRTPTCPANGMSTRPTAHTTNPATMTGRRPTRSANAPYMAIVESRTISAATFNQPITLPRSSSE